MSTAAAQRAILLHHRSARLESRHRTGLASHPQLGPSQSQGARSQRASSPPSRNEGRRGETHPQSSWAAAISPNSPRCGGGRPEGPAPSSIVGPHPQGRPRPNPTAEWAPQGQEDRALHTQTREATPRFRLPISGAKRGAKGKGCPGGTHQSTLGVARLATPAKARAHFPPNQACPETLGRPTRSVPSKRRTAAIRSLPKPSLAAPD
ncbi:hypothetical protein NDU88_008046 [Pleurodeles waltl]|uniref:Uncharacterized protein n=1 Tax=Pleurodeles waltl TaxID=8319 RepID=A0AAV7RWL8_PLEWA|nr:hypothetical protein NDU88_008046 [Pleurodeles waltl]